MFTVFSVLVYGSELWTISSQTKIRLERRDVCFETKMLRMPYTENVINEDVLTIMGTKNNFSQIQRHK